MAQGPGSTRQNNGPFTVGGFYNLAPFTLVDGQACTLQFDINGNLKVTSIGGGGGGSNASVGLTGVIAPTSATEIGVVDAAGNLQHVTGLDLTNAFALTVAIVDGNGNQISSFGGGTQYAAGTTVVTPTGTVALGQDSSNVLHALATDASGNLIVNFSAPQHVILDSGAITSTPSIVDPNNSSSTLLGAGATFTGTATDLLPYKAITVAVFSDTPSGSTGLSVEWSEDGTNWDLVENFSITGGIAITNIFTIKARFFRIVYINGATPQTAFRLQTLLHPFAVNMRETQLSVQPQMADEALLVNAVLQAQSSTSTTFVKLKGVSGALLVAGVDGNGNGHQFSVASDGNTAFDGVLQVGGVDINGNAAPFHFAQGVPVLSVQNIGADGVSNNLVGNLVAFGGQLVNLQVYPLIFNGTTWDRLRSGGATGMVGVAGAAASGAAKAGNPVQIGGVFNTTQPTVTTGQAVEAQSTARGALIVATGVDTFNVAFAAAQHVIVDSGSLTANQGTPNTLANGWPVEITDGTNGPVAIKPASTAALVTDPALVVAISPNNTVAVTQSTSPWVVSLTSTTITGNVTVIGAKSNNSVVPGATNLGVLPGIANAATQTWTEGDQVLESMDLSGRQRIRGTLTHNNVAPSSDLIGVMNGLANASAPTYTEGDLVLQSVDLSGNTRIVGTKTNNSAAPTTQVGVIPAVANAAAPTWTEGDQVLLSEDLSGNTRVIQPKDRGRSVLGLTYTNTANATTTTPTVLTTLVENSNYVSSTGVTAFQVPAGKTLRIQSLAAAALLNSTTAVTAIADAQSVYIEIRVSTTNTTTALSTAPIAAMLAFSLDYDVVGSAAYGERSFPDGVEVPAGDYVGITVHNAITTLATIVSGISLIGYTY